MLDKIKNNRISQSSFQINVVTRDIDVKVLSNLSYLLDQGYTIPSALIKKTITFEDGTPTAREHVEGYSYAKENTVVNVTLNYVSVGFINFHHQGWESLYELGMEMWNSYNKVCSVITMSSCVVRYINKIDFIGFEKLSLADYFNAVPNPGKAIENMDNFSTRVQATNTDINARVTQTVSSYDDKTIDGVTIIIDIQVESDLSNFESVDLKEIFYNLRKYKNEVFAGTITPALVDHLNSQA